MMILSYKRQPHIIYDNCVVYNYLEAINSTWGSQNNYQLSYFLAVYSFKLFLRCC